MTVTKLLLVLFGLALIFSAPELGEITQCYTTVFLHSGAWQSLICEYSVTVKLWFIAPFEILGVAFCILALRKAKTVTPLHS
ncbi:hypothetical protein SAMN04488037_10385 [Shimia marina]|uniref:Uncharacterized protein n=1 Tax=Shimia marina TaxID=321267 RepID=A0A0P1EQR8_9RHOB|nr:hypothetical protein SHM7688_02281 [Shimia marina]SFD88557.1 hypothetical protein SAMN04488037_10385 [Shimia marina]